jgi:hypothetical protein
MTPYEIATKYNGQTYRNVFHVETKKDAETIADLINGVVVGAWPGPICEFHFTALECPICDGLYYVDSEGARFRN